MDTLLDVAKIALFCGICWLVLIELLVSLGPPPEHGSTPMKCTLETVRLIPAGKTVVPVRVPGNCPS